MQGAGLDAACCEKLRHGAGRWRRACRDYLSLHSQRSFPQALPDLVHVWGLTCGHARAGGRPGAAWSEKLRMALGVAQGMQALEAAEPPVLHRDLKPSNVFINAAGRPCVADMGLARRLTPARYFHRRVMHSEMKEKPMASEGGVLC